MNKFVLRSLVMSLLASALCAQASKTPRAAIIAEFQSQEPREWGENVSGVKTMLDTDQPLIALTLDACGGPRGSGFDCKLIDFLIVQKIPATLFINSRWIDANHELFMKLAANPLFEIENHGTAHRPCSVNGKSVYGISGFKNVGEVYDEIEHNALKIESMTGRKPQFFRSGTAYYDDVAVRLAQAMGYEAVNFSVLGDGGATWPKEKIKQALLSAVPGSIILAHMNQPEPHGNISGATADGIIAAIPELQRQGFRFVKLGDVRLK